jgi:hypothetical protein
MQTHGAFLRAGLILALASATETFARTEPTLEHMAIASISAAMQGFAASNDGMYPTNWSQVGLFVDLQDVNRKLRLERESCPVEAHYVFVPETSELAAPTRGGGKVVLIRYTPFEHPTYKLGRYLIVRRGKEYLPSWLQEAEVQELLLKAGVKLPGPIEEEARTARQAMEKALAEETASKQYIETSLPSSTWEERWVALKARVQRVFVEPRERGGANDSSLANSSGHIRPVPVAVAACVVVGSVFFVGWILSRHKRQSRANKQTLSD